MAREKFMVQHDETSRPIGIRYDMLSREMVVGGFASSRYVLETTLEEYFGLTEYDEPVLLQQNRIRYTIQDIGYSVFKKGIDTMREHQLTVVPVSKLGMM